MATKDNYIVCPNCGNNRSITDSETGEIICTKCGFVILEKVSDPIRGWHGYTIEPGIRAVPRQITTLARTGMGLSTLIGRPDRDAGTGYEAVMQSNFDRLRRIDFRIKAQTERSLIHAFRELNRLKSILGLSEMMVEKSAYIYRKAQERGLVRGRTVKAVLAASIYVVFREMGVSRVLDDVSRETGVKRKDLAKVYRIIVKELDLKVPMIDPIKCVAKIANKLDVGERTKREAISIMNNIISRGLATGKDPMGLAAAALYITCVGREEKVNQDDLAEAAGVSVMTLRKDQALIQKNLTLI
jgi:transcription initiation factor TFIIB